MNISKNDLSGLMLNGYAFSINLGLCAIVDVLPSNGGCDESGKTIPDYRIVAYSLEIREKDVYTMDGYNKLSRLHPMLFMSPASCSSYFSGLSIGKLPPYPWTMEELTNANKRGTIKSHELQHSIGDAAPIHLTIKKR